MPFDGRSSSRALEILNTIEERLRNGIWIQYPVGLSVKGGTCLVEAFHNVVAPDATSHELCHLNRSKRREHRQVLDLVTASIRGRPRREHFDGVCKRLPAITTSKAARSKTLSG
jgi:hypothetical protein